VQKGHTISGSPMMSPTFTWAVGVMLMAVVLNTL